MGFPEDQIRYCGATVTNIRSSLGFGGQTSSLIVGLVEDVVGGDNFIAPVIGSPTYFDYNGWSFGGIVQKYDRSRGASGTLYEVNIEDPRNVLSGVKLIINGYTGSTYGIPNLYNVYGYLESTYGYGSSGVGSKSGMSARLIAQAAAALTNTSPIKFNGYSFYLDLTNLINITPADLKVDDDNMSVFDLIHYVADMTLSDFFIRLVYVNGNNVIIPFFYSRAISPPLNAINNFISTTELTYGNVSNSVGRELVLENTSKFVVGGKVQSLEFITQNQPDYITTGQDMINLCSLQDTYKHYIKERTGSSLDDVDSYLGEKAAEASIWPFWGFDREGNVIIGRGPPSSRWSYTAKDGVIKTFEPPKFIGCGFHQFKIDGRPFVEVFKNPNLADYPTDSDELYFALWGFDQWLYYIFSSSLLGNHHNSRFNGQPQSKANTLGMTENSVTLQESFAAYLAAGRGNFDSWLSEISAWTNTVGISLFSREAREQEELALKEFEGETGLIKIFTTNNDKLQLVYSYIKQYAETYYGRKFMVKIPSINVKRDTDSNELIFNIKPSPGAYPSQASIPFIYSSGLLPITNIGDKVSLDGGLMPVGRNADALYLDDGRIQCYVRFPMTKQLYDLDETNDVTIREKVVGVDDYAFVNLNLKDVPEPILSWFKENPNAPEKNYVFVKASLDETPVFLNSSTLEDPRFIVTLDGKVSSTDMVKHSSFQQSVWNTLMGLYLWHIGTLGFSFEDLTPAQLTYIKSIITSATTNIVGQIGSESQNLQEEHGPMVMPDMVALPLENENLTYGPWYMTGAEGATDFEIDNELVPWNYGSYSLLDLVGRSKVSDASVAAMEVESGTVEFPGAPSMLLGDALDANGPVITNISVSIDPQAGVTTTYSMQTWTSRFGEVQKRYIDRLVQLNNKVRESNRKIRELSKTPYGQRSNLNYSAGLLPRATSVRRYNRNTSTSPIIGGQIKYKVDASGDRCAIRSKVLMMPEYYLNNQVMQNYEDKAFASLDSILRPFTTQTTPTPSSLPHFEEPTSNASTPNIHHLNPYARRHDIEVISQDVTIDDNVDDVLTNKNITDPSQYPAPTSVKAFALKGPLIVAGYGYDVNGRPVPANPNNTNEYIDDVGSRMDQWKVGPVDLRWDNNRKVWNASGSSLLIGELNVNIYAAGSGLATLYDTSVHPPVLDNGNTVMVYEFLFDGNSNLQLYAGQKVVLANIGDKHYIVNVNNASCVE